jgi:hypothetical protein
MSKFRGISCTSRTISYHLHIKTNHFELLESFRVLASEREWFSHRAEAIQVKNVLLTRYVDAMVN